MNSVDLVISLDPQTGKLSVRGPLQDPVLCYGMLERAKDVVRDQIGKTNGLEIVPAIPDLNRLRKEN